MKIGSPEHKELFCQSFIASHRQYEPEALPWPDLDDITLQRLRGIPFWGEAVRIETSAGVMVNTFAETITDPLIKEAVLLQGYEETRHSRLLKFMAERYQLDVQDQTPEPIPSKIEPAFIRFGYGECIDSFFAFGLFETGRQLGYFPDTILGIFDPVLDEEARHITFFVNWIAYLQTNRGRGAAPLRAGLTAWNYGRALWNLINLIRSNAGGSGSGFTATGGSIVDANLTVEQFLATCLERNAHRMSGFDARLLRPQLLPAVAALALNTLKLLPKRHPAKVEERSPWELDGEMRG